MAEKKNQQDDVVRTEAPKDSPEGTPLATTSRKYEDPAPDVSNADVDIAAVSLDSAFSKNVENPDPNPLDLVPAPGPSSIEVLGVPKGEDGEPANNPMEHTR